MLPIVVWTKNMVLVFEGFVKQGGGNFFFDKLVNEAVFLSRVEACCQKNGVFFGAEILLHCYLRCFGDLREVTP